MSTTPLDRTPTTAPQPAPARTPAPDHRLKWPEGLAITVALLFAGAVAAGWFNPMLPWLS